MKLVQVLVVSFALVIFASFVKVSLQPHLLTTKPIKFVSAAQESPDDPLARARFEWMQLRDPKTNKVPADIRSQELQYARTLPSSEVFAKNSLNKGQAFTWTARGPMNQGGRTRALAIDLSNENIILAGGVSGGMWRSTDGGATWTRTTSLSDSVQSVTCVAQDPRVGKRNIWYYGTGELVSNSASGGGSNAEYNGDGIFRSTNGGQSWQKLATTATSMPQVFDNFFDFVWNIVVNPVSGTVYAATYGALWRSTDEGQTWTNIGGGTQPFSEFVDVAVTSTGVLYTVFSNESTSKGISRSTNGGTTWNDIAPLSWPSVYRRIVIAIAPSNENVVYFLAETPGSSFHPSAADNYSSFYKYTYVSGDGSGAGGTWEDRSANLPAFGGQVGNFTHQSSYDLVAKVKPNDPNVVFIGGTNLYRSNDGFATTTNTAWIGGYSTVNNVSQYTNHHPDQHSLAFLPSNPAALLSGHDGGISKTTNDAASSVTWSSLNSGYTTSQFYSVAIDQATSGDPVIIGGMQDNGHMFTNTTNGNTPWVIMPAGGDGTITAIANSKTSYYICTQNGSLLRLVLDLSGNPTNFAGVKPSNASGFLFVTPYVLDPNNTDMMYLAAGDRLWRNSNLTAIPTGSQDTTSVNWTQLTNSAVTADVVTAIGVSKSPANRVYYGTRDGKALRLDGANSGNPIPTSITGAGFPTNAYVSCVAVNPRNADTAIAVFSNYSVKSLFLTTNGGTTWTDIGGNLEENPDGTGRGPSCRWATILPAGSSVHVYIGTSTGLYSTSALNSTATVWAQEGASSIGNTVVPMVISRPVDGLVVAATHANGIFSGQTFSTGVDQHSNDVPARFALAQNYPNPFNPQTTIQYTVPRSGFVKLIVLGIDGREIAKLTESEKSAGIYSAVWDGKTTDGISAASGIYFYRLETGGLSETHKMILLK